MSNSNSQPITPRVLDIKGAAKYLSTSIWAIRSLIWSRDLPFIKLGKKFLVDVKDLDAYIEREKVSA